MILELMPDGVDKSKIIAGHLQLRVADDRDRNVRVGDGRGAAGVVDDVEDAALAVVGIQEDRQQVVH